MQPKAIMTSQTSLLHLNKEDYLMHTHDTHEIIYFISVDADYAVEGNTYPLRSGDLLIMRKAEAHSLLPRSSGIYENIIINFEPHLLDLPEAAGALHAIFDSRDLGRFNRFEARLFPDNHWLFYLRRICDCPAQWQKQIYLLALLEELSSEFPRVLNESPNPRAGRTARIISYINEHLFEPLSLQQLADIFYLSCSQLNRTFKQDTGSSVYNYILVKRLFAAQRLLSEGTPPVQVFGQCGFQDYVGFYKAYKKQFSRSPKEDHVKRPGAQPGM